MKILDFIKTIPPILIAELQVGFEMALEKYTR